MRSPISDPDGKKSYRAIAGNKCSVGKTAGQALDALTAQLGETEFSALLVIQSFRPDSFEYLVMSSLAQVARQFVDSFGSVSIAIAHIAQLQGGDRFSERFWEAIGGGIVSANHRTLRQ